MNYHDYLSQTTDDMNMTIDENQAENFPRTTPAAPLPNSGDGGPVYSGGEDNTGSNNSAGNNEKISAAIPIIPLPNPGEGGPVYPGNVPGNIPGGITGNITFPGGIQGTIITVFPRPVTPCFYCNSNSYGTIRFLNAAVGYNPFMVSVNNRTVVDMLSYAEVSEYGRISSGYQTISIVGSNGYIYVSKQVRITVGSRMTIAIVNTASGLDFVEINDVICYTPYNNSCVRACNLSYSSGALNIVSYAGTFSFENVNFTEVTDYTRVVPGRYDTYVSNRNQVLLSTELTVRSNAQYTIYTFNWSDSPTAIRTLIVEDRK